LFTFRIGNTEYEKKHFYVLDFCAVAEYFEEDDYSLPLPLPRDKRPKGEPYPPGDAGGDVIHEPKPDGDEPEPPPRPKDIPTWEGTDILVSEEIRIVGPNGEKVDVMTFRGSYERDIKEFVEKTPGLPF
jgi:hypothetical protein